MGKHPVMSLAITSKQEFMTTFHILHHLLALMLDRHHTVKTGNATIATTKEAKER